MKTAVKIVFGMIPLLALLLICTSATAASISFATTELDAVNNRWQIDYIIRDFDAETCAGFDILFDYDRYANISLISSAADWSAQAMQPEIMFKNKVDGMLDAWPILESGLLSASFSVTFDWLGADTPASQRFELYDDVYEIVSSGTTAAVPVPGSLLLMFSGLAGTLCLRKKTS